MFTKSFEDYHLHKILWITVNVYIRHFIWLSYNLGQNKMEQQTPIPPKSRMKPREGQKRAIFPSLIWGGGEVKVFHLFCPRL